MEVLPSNAFDDGIRFPSLEQDLVLTDDAIRARRAMRSENKLAKTKKFKREAFLDHAASVFDNIGGEPRMTEWADKNPGEFYTKIYAKTITPAINQMQVNASGPVQIVCPIPQSALDDSPELAPDGLALPTPLKDETT